MRTNTMVNVIIAVMLLVAVPVFGQTTVGELTGRVVDTQGNVVPGATVTATNAATGLQRTVVTDASGYYLITQLPPGGYEVSAELSGFRRAVVRNLAVNVGTRLTVNLELTVGTVSETVEVTAAAQLIETTKSDISGVVTPEQIQNLPLLNRTFAGLSVVMPEARLIGAFDPTKTRVGTIAMSGGDGRQLDVNVDGGDNKDNVVGSLLQNFAYESIQEFQVLQHRWTAESGRAVGGVVNVITKSGSNALRGSAFGNFRNNDTRTKDFFETQGAFDKAKFERQEFGGSIGGPVQRDRLFYFGAFERFRERQNSVVPAGAVAQLAAIPGTNPLGEISTPYDDTLVTVKVDHQLSNTQQMFYRFASQHNTSPNDQVGSPARTDLTGGNTNENALYSFVANHTATLGGSRLNQFAFHFQDFKNELLGVTTQPLLTFPSVTTGANINTPQATLEQKWQFRDDFTWQAGDHGVKVGLNYIYTKLDGYFYFGARGHSLTFFDDPLTITTNRALYPQGFATPGAVRLMDLFAGEASHAQNFHQVALYVQDDWRISPNLTANLGLRWDANRGLLFDQRENRTIQILKQLNDPLARRITGDDDKLARTTPSLLEFQPRLGFAYDPSAEGRFVVRGGYGIFYDQVFQNLTLFSFTQIGDSIYQQVLNQVNTAVGVGQAAGYRFGVDPLPTAPPGTTISQLATGAFGRINDPDFKDPYVQKWSLGFQRTIGPNYSLSSDYVHTRGTNEARVQVINPRIQNICDPTFPGSTPSDARCVRGVNTRYFDKAFVDAGLGAGRLEQINMIGGTNSSKFDSWTTTLTGRRDRMQFSTSYVLANSRSWGGQPVASYGGNGIAIAPENQFKEEEYGPTRIDERHRLVFSGTFEVPLAIQLSPLLQIASPRPYSLNAGLDIDGDGLATIDRICEGVDPRAVFDARGNSAAIRALNPRGCSQTQVNSQRGGFIVDANGNVTETDGRFINLDLRVSRTFGLPGTANIKAYADFYNLLNRENLSIGNRLGLSTATAGSTYMQPFSLYGPGFGPPVGKPFTAVFGVRLDF
jgi:outer membrane receptor protein involved in Fe transport